MTRYKVILADPPWSYQTYSQKGKGRSADAHYDCLSREDLLALAPQVKSLADPAGAALCLWVTDPLLPFGIEWMKAAGFTYKTVLFTWVKLNPSADWLIHAVKDAIYPGMNKRAFHMGTGYYTRANPEMCLLGTLGKPPKVQHRDVRQLLVAPRGQHSEKPVEARRRIERLFDGPYVELFSRSSAPGWDVAMSNQAGLLDDGAVATRRWASNSATCEPENSP